MAGSKVVQRPNPLFTPGQNFLLRITTARFGAGAALPYAARLAGIDTQLYTSGALEKRYRDRIAPEARTGSWTVFETWSFLRLLQDVQNETLVLASARYPWRALAPLSPLWGFGYQRQMEGLKMHVSNTQRRMRRFPPFSNIVSNTIGIPVSEYDKFIRYALQNHISIPLSSHNSAPRTRPARPLLRPPPPSPPPDWVLAAQSCSASELCGWSRMRVRATLSRCALYLRARGALTMASLMMLIAAINDNVTETGTLSCSARLLCDNVLAGLTPVPAHSEQVPAELRTGPLAAGPCGTGAYPAGPEVNMISPAEWRAYAVIRHARGQRYYPPQVLADLGPLSSHTSDSLTHALGSIAQSNSSGVQHPPLPAGKQSSVAAAVTASLPPLPLPQQGMSTPLFGLSNPSSFLEPSISVLDGVQKPSRLGAPLLHEASVSQQSLPAFGGPQLESVPADFGTCAIGPPLSLPSLPFCGSLSQPCSSAQDKQRIASSTRDLRETNHVRADKATFGHLSSLISSVSTSYTS